MRLFHGSDTLVDKPVIMTNHRSLDFGSGFYVTSSYEQAKSKVWQYSSAMLAELFMDEREGHLVFPEV